MFVVLTERGVSLPALDLRKREVFGLSLLAEEGKVDPESFQGGIGGRVSLALGPLVLEVPEGGLEYDLASALERRFGARAQGNGPIDLEQRVRLELEDLGEAILVWEARLHALYRARRELERLLPSGAGRRELGRLTLSSPWGRGVTCDIDLPTPLTPFFLHLLDRFLLERKGGLGKRGDRAVYLTEEGWETARVRKLEGDRVHLLTGELSTLVLPRSEVMLLPEDLPVLMGWGTLGHLGELLREGYDPLLEVLEGTGFRKVRVLTLAAPFQLEAEDPEGRGVYFRERGGEASLALSALTGLSPTEAFRRGLYVEAFWPSPLDLGDPEEAGRAFLSLYEEARRKLRLALAKRFFPAMAFRRSAEGLLVALGPLEGAEREAFPWGEVFLQEGRVVGVSLRRELLLDESLMDVGADPPLPLSVRGKEGVKLLLLLLGPPPRGSAYEVRKTGEERYRVTLGHQGLEDGGEWKERVEAFVEALE